MNFGPLRAVGLAIFLGTAVVAGANVATVTSAEAANVRPAVGNLLKSAISLASAGKGSEAMARVHEAESVPHLTSGEEQAISQTKDYIAAKTGAGGSVTGCRAKFVADYNAGRYRDAITDANCLRKGGGLSGQDELVVAQAYYLSGDYASAIRLLHGLGNSQQVLELTLSAAYKSGDAEAMRMAAEQLVLSGKTQYWTNLLTGAENTRGLKDHQQLDLYRLRFLTGNMRNESDYMTAAELALEFGSASEAVDIIQKGLETKALTGERATRLLGVAKTTAAKNAADLAEAEKQAAAAKTGDAAVKIGEDLWGAGKYKDALAEIQSGIAKGVTDKANAQIRLGQAYLGLGQKDAALHAFNSVKGDPAWAVVGHMWSVYARTSK
jgi:hypothetical protein